MTKKVLTSRVRWVAYSLFIAFLLGVPSLGLGQQSVGIGWVTDTVTSRVLGQRVMYIATPEGYDEGQSRYPLLVLLDANDHRMFRLWVAQAAYLADNSPGFPAVIAVGIPNGNDRIHDMTPPATGSSVKDFPNAGGAKAFADFIIDEALTKVRARYRTLPGTFLIGHSAGGLFAVGVAAQRPGAFNGIIATSPALWFNDETLIDTYTDLMARATVHPRLFVSNAENEQDLAKACGHFAKRLTAHAALVPTFAHRIYPDATHTLTPMSVGDGLRFIFEPVSFNQLAIQRLEFAKVDSVVLNDALTSSERTYAVAAHSLGLSQQLPERIFNSLGYRLLGNNKVSLAISVFKRNVQLYPESQNVHDSLGDGFLAAADTTSAIAEFRIAVEKAHKAGVQVHPETQQKLNALETKK